MSAGAFENLCGDLKRQTGLATSSGTSQGEQSGRLQPSFHRNNILRTSHESCEHLGKVVGKQWIVEGA